MTSSSQTPPELLESLNRPVPMPVAQAARVIEDDYAKALTDVRRYARQLDIVPDNIAEENEQTHAQDNDLAKKRVLYRQAGLFKIRREFLENKATIETLEAERKAAKKLRERFKASGEISKLKKRQKTLSQALADPNGYVNKVRANALAAEVKAEAARKELAEMKKAAENGGEEGEKKVGLWGRFKIKVKEETVKQLSEQANSLKGIDIDLTTPQFQQRMELEAHGLKTRRTQLRNTRKNLNNYIAEAEEKLSPRHKALEVIWRMERYGYGDIPVPLIQKKDAAAVSKAAFDAQEKAQYADDQPLATPEDLLVRFDASYRQAEIAADVAPGLLDEIENDMRVLEKELKKTRLGKKLLKADIQQTHKDYGYRHDRRTGGLIDMIRDIFTRGRKPEAPKTNPPKTKPRKKGRNNTPKL